MLNEEQKNFNERLELAFEVAKKCFGFVKGRFKRLQETFSYCDTQFVSQCVTTACILHNLCIQFKDQCNYYTEDMNFIEKLTN